MKRAPADRKQAVRLRRSSSVSVHRDCQCAGRIDEFTMCRVHNLVLHIIPKALDVAVLAQEVFVELMESLKHLFASQKCMLLFSRFLKSLCCNACLAFSRSVSDTIGFARPPGFFVAFLGGRLRSYRRRTRTSNAAGAARRMCNECDIEPKLLRSFQNHDSQKPVS